MEQPQSCWQQNNNLVGTLEEALSWLRSRAEDVKANARELFLIFCSKLGYALKAGQLTYDCHYSTIHGMPVTGGPRL